MHSFLGFLGTVILFIEMVNYAHADTGGEDAERLRLRTGVVLKVGEIDSSTIEVDALAVVVYETGERHPVSGEWAKLDAARGYIKAVDAEALTLALGRNFGPEWIALEHIQILPLVGLYREGVASSHTVRRFGEMQYSLSRKTEGWDDMETGKRIANKLVNGAFWGTAFGVGAGIGVGALFAIGDPVGFVAPVGAISGASIGSVVGSAFGVSRIDLQAPFVIPLTGSLVGSVAGILVIRPSISGKGLYSLFWSLVACPVVGATLVSEWWRRPTSVEVKPKSTTSHISVDLVLDTRGCLSVISTVYF